MPTAERLTAPKSGAVAEPDAPSPRSGLPWRNRGNRYPSTPAALPVGPRHGRTLPVGLVLAGVLAVALVLRLWGIGEGLPYVYDLDEGAHFVPHAIQMTGLRLNPNYFANPPALTYLLHVVFTLWYGGYANVTRAAALHPAQQYEIARTVVALLGTLAVGLLYILGARLFDRRVALLAAALEAVAFLPVFYSHLALNDAPALVPVTLSLIGSAGVMDRGRPRDYALAGLGVGLGAATKYTAGIVVLALLAAIAVRAVDGRRAGAAQWRRLALGLALASVVAAIAFVAANPYSVLDLHRFTHELNQESAIAGEAGGKLGAPRESGIVYYLWTLTWGVGWVPAAAALGGGLLAWVCRRRVGALLTPMIVVFVVVIGSEQRYFGRWLMPVVPAVCALAAYFALAAAAAPARLLARRSVQRAARSGAGAGAGNGRPNGAGPGSTARSRWQSPWLARAVSAGALGLAVVALLAQGAIHSIAADRVMSRPNTLGLARAWMVAHIPAGARIVVEPVVQQAWLHEAPGLGRHRRAYAPDAERARWTDYPWLLTEIVPAAGGGAPWRVAHEYRRVEDYEYTLSPSLLDYYTQRGYCWVVTASQQSGRAYADPARVPDAIAYYRALARRGEVVERISPYATGTAPVAFSFDWSYDDYPLSVRLPGPEVTIYRLHGGGCDTAG